MPASLFHKVPYGSTNFLDAIKDSRGIFSYLSQTTVVFTENYIKLMSDPKLDH